MKKTTSDSAATEEMLPEYDLAGKRGIRGKYHQAYKKGHGVRITRADGSIDVQTFTLPEGAVLLEPDVRAYFPDSESVNTALRGLIALIPSESRHHKTG
jgi:hypothetical protein